MRDAIESKLDMDAIDIYGSRGDRPGVGRVHRDQGRPRDLGDHFYPESSTEDGEVLPRREGRARIQSLTKRHCRSCATARAT